MNTDFFVEANKLWRKGFQDEAFESLESFVNSFENEEEKKLWVKDYLPTLKIPKDEKIKSKFVIALFKKIIAPVILKKVKERDTYFMLWAYKLSTSLLFNNPNPETSIYSEMNIKSFQKLLIELYEMEPNSNEVKGLYINTRISQIKQNVFNNSKIYENWNPDYARNYTTEDCKKDLAEIEILKKIDQSNEYVGFLKKYEENLNKLMEKLI